MLSADAISLGLGLLPHPEGGRYKEVFRSGAVLQAGDGRTRTASTAIYFLLTRGEFSAFHRVSSDELWHHYSGDPLELHVLDEVEGARVYRLGSNLENGERPLGIVPGGAFQAARPLEGPHGYALVGCTVAPGFEFSDFELPEREWLIARFPDYVELITAFTRV